MTTRNLYLDKAALGLSGLCVLHCLALPILGALMPVLAGIAEAEWLHKLFVLLAAPISITAIYHNGFLSARSQTVFAAAVATGLLLLFSAAFAEALHDWEVPLTVAGALVLMSSHFWRWKTLGSMSAGQDSHHRIEPGS